jgi:hypothetical protein
MREILKQQNLDLLRELKISKEWIAKANTPEEMQMYHKAISDMCNHLLARIYLNLSDLDTEADEIIDDVRSETQTVIDYFSLLNERLIGPIRRFLPSDRICLKILGWLHNRDCFFCPYFFTNSVTCSTALINRNSIIS